MKVNIMLSVAENEADRTGERIKVVFERKIANGEPIGGKAMLPIGYKTENKEIVADEYADAVKAGFDYYEKTGSIHATMDYLHSEHNLQVIMATVKKMLHNKSYTGMYRGNPSFFPQIVTIEQFQRVQEMLNARSVRKNKANRVYLFPGIITCACCGHRLAGMYSTSGYYYYRCNHAQIDHLCNNRKMVSELQLEQWLLVNVEDAFDGMATAELSPKQGKKKVNNAEINKKLERLKDLYVDGLITKPQYIADYEKLQAALNENTAPARRDYAGLRNLVGEALRPSYAKLTRDNKRILWRSIIDHITVDADGNKQIFFAV